MLTFILIILLMFLVLSAVSLLKSYRYIPLKEVRRRAQKGDELAKTMYRAMAYGVSLTVLLWGIVGVTTTALFFGLIKNLPWPVAAFGVLAVLIVGFAWLPNTKMSRLSEWIVRFLTPPIAWILNFLHPVLERFGLFVQRHTHGYGRTKLYEKEDLVDLLTQQESQTDSRILKDELDIARHALMFGDILVRDVLTPHSQVVQVSSLDTVGPLLLDELHKSGHSRFPVYEDKDKNSIVGVLYLHDLIKKPASGAVARFMHEEVYYIHEEQTLYEALQAFLKTKHHLFIVVNSFEEITGVITIEDVIEKIIGKPIVDEFDQYEDLRAVAAKAAQKAHHQQAHIEPLLADTEPEVLDIE
jgi:CBS domain containing-hemolysin-like protein